MAPPGGKHPGWKIFRLTAGWALLVLGFIGLFLPVLQGILFIASGLAILSPDWPWAKRLLLKLKSFTRRHKTPDNEAPD